MDTDEQQILQEPPAPPELLITTQPRWKIHSIAIAVLLLLVLAMFGDVLFTGRSILLSQEGKDLTNHFLRWRTFGFNEMKHGNIPLWNPHLFCGAPYVGGFQSALFYPPNLLHLVLPHIAAINWLIAIHVFLGGLLMYLWAHSKGLSAAASLLTAVLFMFCGGNFLRIYVGHIPIIYSTPWIPLLFWSLDRYLQKCSLGSGLVIVLSLTMQILAGHPQTVFYTAIAAGLYTLFHLIKAQRRGWLFAGWAAMCVGVVGLTAVQVFPGLNAVSENVRSQGGFTYAATFSFPPENFITLLVPYLLGNSIHFPYWGRCLHWEMCLYMGITGFALCTYAAVFGPREQKRFLAPLAVIMSLLALGEYTPLFKILYDYVPMFDTFRGNCKFGLQISFFMAILAGIGVDQFHVRASKHLGKRSLIFPLLAALVAIAALVAGIMVYRASLNGTGGGWQKIVYAAINSPKQVSVVKDDGLNADFVRRAGRFAAINLYVAAGTLALLATLLFATRHSSRQRYVLLGLAVIEVFVFARIHRATFNPSATSPAVVASEKFIREHPGDHRILDFVDTNGAMKLGVKDIWGYDPSVSLRYAEFITYTQGLSTDMICQYVFFQRWSPLYRMLRLRYIFFSKPDGCDAVEQADPLPRVHLLTDYAVVTQRDHILGIMSQPTFDPAKHIVLERQPKPAPIRSASPGSASAGSAKIVNEGTDHLTIEADVAQPAILLVTDSYSKDWRVQSLPGSSQQQYDLMPANYILRAVPLAAGHHIFRMEYAPAGFTIGKWVTLLSLVVYLVLIAWWARLALKPPTFSPITFTTSQ